MSTPRCEVVSSAIQFIVSANRLSIIRMEAVNRAVALTAALGLAWALPTDRTRGEEPMKVREIEGISEYSLENGCQLLLFPDPSKPVVTVNVTIFVGSRHEGYGEAGMAHLLEHMLFKGTPAHPEIPKVLQEHGARFNGTTWTDRTNYYETMPASDENLEFALRLEADRLVNSKILGEDLASEMSVVRSEFESGENSPIRVLMQRMQGAAYEWHNYGKSTIGNRSDIERVPVVKLRQFYKKFYRPDNVMVCVAGKFDPAKALDLVNKYFGSLSTPDTPLDRTYTVEPAQDGERTVVLRRVGDVQWVASSYHVPAGSHADYPAVKALTYVLADEPSGRLYTSLVESEMASNVYASCDSFHDPGMMQAIVEVPADGEIESVRKNLLTVLEKDLAESPVTEEEVERARQQLLKQRELEAADSDKLAVALSNWAAQGDWRLYFLFRDRLEKLTAADVQRVAEQYLNRNNRTVGLFIPTESAERITIPEAPDLNTLLADYKGRESIQTGEAFDVDPLAIERRTQRGKLAESVQYSFIPKKTRGASVHLMLTLRYGTPETLSGRVTACDVLPDLMERGTESLSYQEFQDQLAALRSSIRLGGTTGLVQASVKSNRDNLPAVLELLTDAIRKPKLDAEEFEVLRRQYITQIESQLSEPQALAPIATRRAMTPYPKSDIRYRPTLEEEIELYRTLKVEEVRELHANFVSSQASEVAAVGDFDPEELKSMLTKTFSGWTTDEPYERVDRPAHPELDGRIETIVTPDKANAVYYSGMQFVMDDAGPDYAPLVMGNYILGAGALSSRLGDRVRQTEGLSYGIRSGFNVSPRDNRGEFTIFAITNPVNKDRLMVAIREEIDKILADGVTEEELAKAKEGFLQRQSVSRSDDSALVSQLVLNMFTGRTMKFTAETEQAINSATVDQVHRVLKKYINPDKLIISVAGDFKDQ